MIIRLKLKELLEENNMTQKEFANLSGMRESTVSELCRNTKTSVNKEHITTIAETLEINSVADLIEMKK